VALFRERDSHALYLLEKQGVDAADLLRFISHGALKVRDESGLRSHSGGDDELHAQPQGDDEDGGLADDPLTAYCVDLIARAADGRIDPLVGRKNELERTIQVLCRRRKNNPIYVGEAGVGKTALAEGLASAIQERKVPTSSRTRRCTRSIWAPCSPGRSSAASSRSGSKAVVKSLAEKPGATPLHRRDPHAGRRRRDQRGSMDARIS